MESTYTFSHENLLRKVPLLKCVFNSGTFLTLKWDTDTLQQAGQMSQSMVLKILEIFTAEVKWVILLKAMLNTDICMLSLYGSLRILSNDEIWAIAYVNIISYPKVAPPVIPVAPLTWLDAPAAALKPVGSTCKMNKWMNKWMNEWTNKWTNEWINK